MPSFGTVALPDINPLFDLASIDKNVNTINAGRLANQLSSNTLDSRTQLLQNAADSGTQDLTDRSTLRGLAGGLSSGDPNAVAGAAVLPGGPGAVTAVLPFYNQQSNATSLGDIRKSLQPGDPSGGAPSGGAQPGAGASAAPIGDFQHAMSGRESTNDPTAVNAGGYAGLYQFGAPRLAAIHAYTPAPGEIDENGKWNGQMNGQFHIAGHPEVKTLADFLHNPNAQDAAFQSHVAGIDAAISQTPGADKLDVNGLRAVAHLGGIEGMQQFVATNGAYNPGDNPNAPGGGTHLLDYYKRFAAGGAPALQQAFGHPQGPPQGRQQAAAPGVTVAPDQTVTAPESVQVAGPGAPTASAMPTQPGTQGVDDVMARLRAGDPAGADIPGPDPTLPPPGYLTRAPQIAAQPAGVPGPAAAPAGAAPAATAPAGAVPAVAPPQAVAPLAGVPGHTGPLASMLPAGPIPTAPANGLAGSGPTFMPAASSAPPPGAVQAPGAVQPAQSSGQPAPGLPPAPLVLLPNGLTQQQTTDFINLSNRRTTDPAALTTAIEAARQQNRTAQQQYFTDTKMSHSDSGTQRTFFDSSGNPVRNETIAGTGRETLVHPFGDGRSQMEKDGNLIGPVFPADTREFSINLAKNDNEKVLPALSQQALDFEQTLQKTVEARDAAAKVPTGANFDNRAAMANWLTTYAPDVAKSVGVGAKGGLLPNPAQAAEAGKLLMGQAQQSEKAMGGSGGLGITKMFVDNNPNPNMKGEGIRDMSNLLAVTAMANKDYLQGKISHIDTQTAALQTPGGGQYKPTSAFEKAWFSQDNTHVYYGAVQAMNGQPFEAWSKGLSDADKQRALGVIARIDPASKVLGDNGHPLSVSKFVPTDMSNPSGVVAR